MRKPLFVIGILLVVNALLPLPVLSQDISVLMREGDALWVKRKDIEKASRKMMINQNRSLKIDFFIITILLISSCLVPERKVMFRPNPNVEIRNPKQIQISNDEMT